MWYLSMNEKDNRSVPCVTFVQICTISNFPYETTDTAILRHDDEDLVLEARDKHFCVNSLNDSGRLLVGNWKFLVVGGHGYNLMYTM